MQIVSRLCRIVTLAAVHIDNVIIRPYDCLPLIRPVFLSIAALYEDRSKKLNQIYANLQSTYGITKSD